MEQPSDNVSIRLVWTNPGDGEPRQLVAEVPIAIGRVGLNDIAIDSDEISRYHVRIENHNGEITVIDQGSTNGTFLNGQRVSRARLYNGDQIQTGPVIFGVSFDVEKKHDEQEGIQGGKLSGLGEINKTVMLPPTKKSTHRPPDDEK